MVGIVHTLLFTLFMFIYSALLVGMDQRPALKSLILSQKELQPPESTMFLDEDNFKQLIRYAESGNARLQFALGCRYLNGVWPLKRDSVTAQNWLLRARKQDYLPAYGVLIDAAEDAKDYKKAIEFANVAVERGFVQYNLNIAAIYKNMKKYTKALEYYDKALKAAEPYQDNYIFQWIKNTALTQIALSKLHGWGIKKDSVAALKDLQELAQKENNTTMAAYEWALQNLAGNEVFESNPIEALRVFEKIRQTTSPFSLTDTKIALDANIRIGLLYEKGPKGIEKDYNKAIEYYSKSPIAGTFHKDRLILTDKIQGDKQAARNSFIKASAINVLKNFSGYLYGTILMAQNKLEEGLQQLESIDLEYNVQPLTCLQLAIAYHYGMGVKQNKQKAEHYLSKIKNESNTYNRSLWLARGYMRLTGLGCNKDIHEGLRLIEVADSKFDDVFFDAEEILPIIKRIKSEQLQATNDMVAEPVMSEVSDDIILEAEYDGEIHSLENAFSFSKEEWNKRFKTDDGSFISNIDSNAKTFTIRDPKRKEELEVHCDQNLNRDFSSIEALRFHTRIGKRQLAQESPSAAHNHTFAQMLDYVIQYVGQLVPFIKDGISEPNDQLVAKVIRKNSASGKKTDCTAEYTFGKKGKDNVYVYHRLLRPINK